MDKNNSIFQPELPFEESPDQLRAEASAPGLPEFISNNPSSLDARERGIQRAIHDLGAGKDTQKLPTQRDTQAEKTPDEFPPLDRESLRDIAELALVNEMLDEQRAHKAFLEGKVTIIKP